MTLLAARLCRPLVVVLLASAVFPAAETGQLGEPATPADLPDADDAADAAEITCSVDDYVERMFEFYQCQSLTLKGISDTGNPCPMLDRLVKACAGNVEPCYTERGLFRNHRVYFDNLALQYPAVNECDIMSNQTDLWQKEAGERCAISEVVALYQKINVCRAEEQSQLASMLPGLVKTHGPGQVFDTMCAHLKVIHQQCIMAQLSRCFQGHDLNANAAFLLETVQVTSSVFALHLANVTSLAECPVFTVDARRLRAGDGDGDLTSRAVVIAAVALGAVALTVLVVVAAAYVLYKRGHLGKWAARVAAAAAKDPPYDTMTEETAMSQQGPGRGTAAPGAATATAAETATPAPTTTHNEVINETYAS